MLDKDEITVVVSCEVYDEYCREGNRGKGENDAGKNHTHEYPDDNGIGYRLFTFDNVVLDPSLVAFMAVVTKRLADCNISVLPYAAYSTDHILVAEEDAERARAILEGLTDGLLDTTAKD